MSDEQTIFKSHIAISREMAQDSRLSFAARGMMTYLLSITDETEIPTSALAVEGRCYRGQMSKLIEELKAAGYFNADNPDGLTLRPGNEDKTK